MRFGLGLDLTSAEAAPSGDEPPTLTFSTGLTRVANTITANLSTGIAGSQSVVGGTAASETLTLSSTAHATKGKILFGTAAYDEVNNYLGIGTVSPSSKIDITTDSLGTTQANTSGLSLVNTTAAAAGVQQISPGLRFRGYGWKTAATAASQPVDFRMHVLPIQGSAAPTSNLVFSSSINGGAYTDLMTLSASTGLSIGIINGISGSATNFSQISTTSVGIFSFGAGTRSRMSSPADGQILFQNAGSTDFSLLQFGGTSALFPAWKRSTTTLQARLADDSDYTEIVTKFLRSGSGSPEGVETAPVGALYRRTDGGASTTLYVKESGAGNTGWVAK